MGKLATSLAIFFVMTVPSLSAGAQASAPCTTPPCVQVAYQDHPGHLASDAAHFIYAPEGEEVTISVLAEFTPAYCTAQCQHGDRSVTWTVSGAEGYSVLDVDATIPYVTNNTAIRLNLGAAGAGDTISVTCAIGATTPGECNEKKNGDLYEHTPNSHGGASATCTIKLWRLDITTDAQEYPSWGHPNYQSTFAEDVTTTVTPVGASAVFWEWESRFTNDYSTVLNSDNGPEDWSGRFVDRTNVSCNVTVINGCYPATYRSNKVDIIVNPDVRRDGWSTQVQLAGTNDSWLSNEPRAFPQIDWSWIAVGTPPKQELPVYGRNANARANYDNEFDAIVVPFYSLNSAPFDADYGDFSSKRDFIDSGPNKGFYYNIDNTMYEIKRKILSNYWIKPSAGHPTTPANDNHNNPYLNWLSVFEAERGADCWCSNPTVHGGTGSATYYRANLYHEGTGNPNSPNERLLGHHSRLEDRFAAGPRTVVDPIYRCDLLYSSTEDGLRALDETQRLESSNELSLAQGAIHGWIASSPLKHNYKGDVIKYTISTGWGVVLKDTF